MRSFSSYGYREALESETKSQADGYNHKMFVTVFSCTYGAACASLGAVRFWIRSVSSCSRGDRLAGVLHLMASSSSSLALLVLVYMFAGGSLLAVQFWCISYGLGRMTPRWMDTAAVPCSKFD